MLGEPAGRKHLDRSGEIHRRLTEHHLDAGMLGIGRSEDRRALVRLVDRVLLGDQHRRERLPVVRIDKRDLVTGPDRVDERLIGGQA